MMPVIENPAYIADIDPDLLLDAFYGSIDRIFSFGIDDVKAGVNKLSTKNRDNLRNYLSGKCKVTFPQLKDGKLMARRAAHLMTDDVVMMGQSLANGTAHKDLDGIFKVKKNEAPPADLPADIPSLVTFVVGLMDRISSLEKQVKHLKPPAPSTLAESLHDETSSEAGETTDGDSDNEDEEDDEEEEEEEENEEEEEEENEKKDEPVKELTGVIHGPPKKSTKQTTLTAATSKKTQPNSKSVFIGRVNPGCTEAIVKKYIVDSVKVEPVKVSLLSKARGVSSFKVDLKKQQYQRVANHKKWPAGVIVEPFRHKTQNNQPKNRKGQGNQGKSSHSSSNHSFRGQKPRQNERRFRPPPEYYEPYEYYPEEFPPLPPRHSYDNRDWYHGSPHGRRQRTNRNRWGRAPY